MKIGKIEKVLIVLIIILLFAIKIQEGIQKHNPNTVGSATVSSYPFGIMPTVPGATNPDITQANIKQNICAGSAWSTSSIRPSVSYTNKIKLQKLKDAGLTDIPSNYELDHLISIELGGNPTDPNNLWNEPYNISYNGELLGARQKDRAENILHSQVCAGTITLDQAQKQIVSDWVSVYEASKTKVGSEDLSTDLDDN